MGIRVLEWLTSALIVVVFASLMIIAFGGGCTANVKLHEPGVYTEEFVIDCKVYFNVCTTDKGIEIRPSNGR